MLRGLVFLILLPLAACGVMEHSSRSDTRVEGEVVLKTTKYLTNSLDGIEEVETKQDLSVSFQKILNPAIFDRVREVNQSRTDICLYSHEGRVFTNTAVLPAGTAVPFDFGEIEIVTPQTGALSISPSENVYSQSISKDFVAENLSFSLTLPKNEEEGINPFSFEALFPSELEIVGTDFTSKFPLEELKNISVRGLLPESLLEIVVLDTRDNALFFYCRVQNQKTFASVMSLEKIHKLFQNTKAIHLQIVENGLVDRQSYLWGNFEYRVSRSQILYDTIFENRFPLE